MSKELAKTYDPKGIEEIRTRNRLLLLCRRQT